MVYWSLGRHIAESLEFLFWVRLAQGCLAPFGARWEVIWGNGGYFGACRLIRRKRLCFSIDAEEMMKGGGVNVSFAGKDGSLSSTEGVWDA